MFDVPQQLLTAILNARTAFREQDMAPPTVMIVGEDIQKMLLYAGWRPLKGTWGTVAGVEIRGVSDYVAGMLEGRLIIAPPNTPAFKVQILGEFVENPPQDNEPQDNQS